MSKHIVVGAGPIGTATSLLLAERGEEVVIVTRSGSGPTHPAITRTAADASSSAGMAEIAAGAVAIYNCANPAYHRWPTDWPPIAQALLTAAERSNAVLVTVSNLYGYGPVSGPMTEDLPLAAQGPKGSPVPRCGAMPSPRTTPAACAPPRSAGRTTSDPERRATWVSASSRDCSPAGTSR